MNVIDEKCFRNCLPQGSVSSEIPVNNVLIDQRGKDTLPTTSIQKDSHFKNNIVKFRNILIANSINNIKVKL